MNYNQKTKRVTIIGYVIWSVYIFVIIGLLSTAVVASVYADKNSIISPTIFNYILWALTILLVFNSSVQYYFYRKSHKYFLKVSPSIISSNEEIAITNDVQDDQQIGLITVSAVLNHSLESLNEKNARIKEEIEMNQRLSETILAFYKQMKTLRDADLIFDFYEYDINNAVFVFMSGLVSTLAKDIEETEVTAKRLFSSYNLSMNLEEFNDHINNCIYKKTDMLFECSVKSPTNTTHWLKFWGRLSKDGAKIAGAVTEITREVEGKNIEKERAIRDNITGFYNRNALSEVAQRAFEQCAEDEKVIFVYIGLRGYQQFQERFGKMAGNSYIRECAKLFKTFVKSHMIPLRWLGPDFLLLVTGAKSIEEFRNKTLDTINKVEALIVEVEGVMVSFPVAVGYAISGIHGQTPAELLEYASFAEHEVLIGKEASPNEFNQERFEQTYKASLRRTYIKEIIEKNQLSIVFQPIISLRTAELFGFEALSRPTNPAYSNITELINDAETSGNYISLERRMVYNALDAYMERDQKYKDQYLFINTAPYATLDEDDYNDIRDRYFSNMNVVFEVIERNQMDPEEINLRKSIVKNAGAKFALDDFGSGYSNHLALLSLEPDIIKIDRQLVQNIHEDLRKQYMLEDIISYARYRGTRVLAEGVEIKEELEALCRMGIDYVQGYYVAKPNSNLIGASEESVKLIKSINPNIKIRLKQVYIIIEKTFEMLDNKFGSDLSIVLCLVIQIGRKLGYDKVKLKDMVITTMLHNIGRLYPGSEFNSAKNHNDISSHSIFASLLFKEFSPCPEYARAILYHHKKYKDTQDDIKRLSISIPDEAYLLSITSELSEIFLSEPKENAYDQIMLRINSKDVNPEHRTALIELAKEGVLNKIINGEYREELLKCIEEIDYNKAEIESVLRTFIYAITFRNPYNYSHAKIMETSVDLLGRMTKQSWHLLENVHMAAQLYNIGMLSMDKDELEKQHTPLELHTILEKSVGSINRILQQAGLTDIANIFSASVGEKSFQNHHMLMSKDIIDGARMLNLAEFFASIIELEADNQEITYNDAIDELVRTGKNHGLSHPALELIQEYKDDVEARIKASQDDIKKHYNTVMSIYKRLSNTLLDEGTKI